MQNAKRYLLIVLVFLFSMSILTGCVGPTGTISTETTATGSSTTKTAPEKPDKFTMFFGNAGITFPDDVDPDDNPFFEVFEKAANVDVEMIMPSYSEFQTKFQLMLSTGDIPDLVHCWYKSEIDKYGIEGAFLDWTTILPKSSILKSYYSDDAIKLMQTTDGGVYALNTLANGNVNGSGIRLDLVNSLNNGKMPVTPTEWYEFFKNIKEAYPDSVPLSPNKGTTFYRVNGFFNAFGVMPWGLQRLTSDSTEFFWFFEAERCKDAVLFYKKLYDEDILYKEFPTVVSADHKNLVLNKKIAYHDADEGNLIEIQQWMLQKDEKGNVADQDAIWVFAPPMVAEGVNVKEAVQGSFYPLGGHCVAISSQTNETEQLAVLRFLEAISDKDLLYNCVWGREGIEYTVNNGEKIINNEAHTKTEWRLAYQFFRSYYYSESTEFNRTAAKVLMTEEQKKLYDEEYAKGLKTLQDAFNSNPPTGPANFIQLPDLAPKLNEANSKAHEIVYRAIMGEITMEQYDAEVNAFLNQYQFIKDAYNNEIKKYIK